MWKRKENGKFISLEPLLENRKANEFMANDQPPVYDSISQDDSALPRPTESSLRWQDMLFSIGDSLVEASRLEAIFLSTVDGVGHILYDDAVTRNAIRRYETCWIPLQVQK